MDLVECHPHLRQNPAIRHQRQKGGLRAAHLAFDHRVPRGEVEALYLVSGLETVRASAQRPGAVPLLSAREASRELWVVRRASLSAAEQRVRDVPHLRSSQLAPHLSHDERWQTRAKER